MKTFSKIGLAGIRLGYLFGDKCIIENINKLRLPFNINSLSQKISELAIENNQHLEIQINEICELRDKLLKNMKEINEIRVFESKTNFVLFKALSGTADDIFKSLLSDKILIKNMTNAPGLKNCLRVTVGSENENKIFIQSLKNAIK
jgi:histidinol-phosphate aminotransferase